MSDDAIYTRAVDFALERATADSDGLTLEGYAAVFNRITAISDWDGEYDEQVLQGAFRKTIRESTPVIQFDHGQHPLIGSMPIASARRLREDPKGLWLSARVFDNWLTEPLRDAIREEAISGMSFRFQVIKDEWDESGKRPLRSIKEVKLLELGPVVWPAYKDTSVALRSLQRVLPDLQFGTHEEPALPHGSSERAATDHPQEAVVVHDSSARQALARRLVARNAGRGVPNVQDQ
jgi:HK97 family phage prohead protease